MGPLCFSTSTGGTLEGGVPFILPGKGSEHRGMYAWNKTFNAKCGGAIWCLHTHLMYEGHMLIYNPHRNIFGVGADERCICIAHLSRAQVG